MKSLILSLIGIMTLSTAMAEDYSMRRCMLLPIYDSAGDSFGFKVYEEVEKYLKSKGWCDYNSSAEVISIFSKYRERLDDYLEDPKVLQTVSNRLKVGTLIRVKLKYEVDKIEVELSVVGENGEDIYFQEKTILNKVELYQVRNTIINWLEIYETSIPYDGKVLGVLGDQITFSFPKSKRVGVGQEFKVKKFIQKKKHPLLKRIVEWDSLPVGQGKVFNVSRGQGLGMIKVYTSQTKVNPGDWVRLEKYDPRKVGDDKDFSKYQEHSFGKLGEVSLSFDIANHTTTSSAASGNNKINGLIYGVSTKLELWVTRSYFILGEFSKRIGELSTTSGDPQNDSHGQDVTALKLLGGFKYLPMGYFYGPQVNIYGGWGSHSYQVDESGVDGFGANSISGLVIGAGGSIPLKKGIRVFGSGEIIPLLSEFEDEDNIYGSNKSISSMVIEVGGTYQWNPSMRLRGAFEIKRNSAKFSGSNSEISYNDTAFETGVVFNF